MPPHCGLLIWTLTGAVLAAFCEFIMSFARAERSLRVYGADIVIFSEGGNFFLISLRQVNLQSYNFANWLASSDISEQLFLVTIG